jgi:hypothetical protein
MPTGFDHDLKAVFELAHCRGAVYAYATQAVGAIPLDGKAESIPRLSSYK